MTINENDVVTKTSTKIVENKKETRVGMYKGLVSPSNFSVTGQIQKIQLTC